MHATSKTPFKNPTNPLNVRYIGGHELRKVIEKNESRIMDEGPIITKNADGKQIPLQSYFLAMRCIEKHFLEGKELQKEDIESYSWDYYAGTDHIRQNRDEIFGQLKNSDLRVTIYTRCINDMISAKGPSFNSREFEKLIMNQDAGAMLTELERLAKPGKNPRMDKGPIGYYQQAVEMLLYLLDVSREFKTKDEGKQRFEPLNFNPFVATLDLGSRLDSLPMAFGTLCYFMTYDKKTERLYMLPENYNLIVALQSFDRNQAMAIAYHVTGTSILRSIKKTDALAVIGEKLEAALECFSCALRIKYDYADAIEGKAYVFMLMKKGELSRLYYDFANKIRHRLEKEYAAFKQEHAPSLS